MVCNLQGTILEIIWAGRKPLPLKTLKVMKIKLQELLKEFIEREYDLEEIHDVINPLFELYQQKKLMTQPCRDDMREFDYIDYDILQRAAKEALEDNYLDYDPEDLI